MDDKRFRDLETETALIKRELGHFGTLFAKLDITIDKMTNLLNDINKVSAVQEERIDYLQGVDKENELKSQKNTEEIRVILSKMESMNMYLLGEITNCEDNLKTELKAVIESTDKKIKELNDSVGKLNEQVNHLERWRWLVIGFVLVAGWVLDKIPLFVELGSKG